MKTSLNDGMLKFCMIFAEISCKSFFFVYGSTIWQTFEISFVVGADQMLAPCLYLVVVGESNLLHKFTMPLCCYSTVLSLSFCPLPVLCLPTKIWFHLQVSISSCIVLNHGNLFHKSSIGDCSYDHSISTIDLSKSEQLVFYILW